MPLDVEATKELKQQLGMARKMPLNFGLALGKKAEDTALLMHRKKQGSLLYKQARKADGVAPAKSCHGTLTATGNVLTFACETDPPAGMKKICREFLKSGKLSYKIKILAPDGEEFEAEDEDGAAETSATSPQQDDPNKEKWQQAAPKIQEKLVAALQAGKGDVSKMRAVWALATEKAEAGDYTTALQAAAALLKLIGAAGEARRTEAEEQSGHVVRDTLDGKELLAELKSKGDQIKAALELLPKRVAEGRQFIIDVTQGVKNNDLDLARVAMARIDMLLRDAEPVAKAKSEFQMAEGRLASRARGLADLPDEDATLKPLLTTYRAAMEKALTAASDGDWTAAREALPAWINALGALESARRGQLDLEGQYKTAEAELTPRAAAIRDLPPAAPGLGDIVNAYQNAAMAAIDLAEKSDWAGALAKVPEWRRQLELAEAAHETYHRDKDRFETIYDPLQGDLAKAMKLGAVNTTIGDLCQQVREKAATARTAADNLDFAAGIPAAEDLARLVPALLKARETYVAQRAEWGAKFGAISGKIAHIEGCGALDGTLDPLKAGFDTAIADARARAKVNDYAGALAKLDDVVVKADAFLRAKATFDQAREDVFDEARNAGKDDIPDIPTAGHDDGATIAGVVSAMEGSNSLKKSKGLQKLLDEARVVDKQFADAIASPDAVVSQAVLPAIQKAIANCEAYQRDHKEDARSTSDREKFAQAQSLADHYRAMVAELLETIPVLTTLDAIDPVALATDEAGALRALGQIDAIMGSALSKAARDIAERKRRDLVANMMKLAPTPNKIREVAMMAGGDFRESYERQMALGPLTRTVSESRTGRDHQATRIQPPADAANVDETRRLAQRLITDDGRLELAALYACNPEDLAGDSPSSRQTARALKRLRDDPEAIAILENIAAPEKNSPAARMVSATLGLPADAQVTAAQARQAALASLMAELRQKDVGSCFATQVAINIHDTDPKRYLKDVSDMISNGAITRQVGGKTATFPIETRMSDAALETSTLKLSRADNPDLLGSSTGIKPAEKTKLEEVPAFQSAFDVLGVSPDDREAAMAAALQTMQGSDEFKKNQNAKALKAAVATIADADKRKDVFKAAMAQLEADGDNVKTALEQAMAAENVPDADPANQAAAADAAKQAFDTIGAEAEFDVEPGLVVRQIVMDKVGLTEAEIAKQQEYERAAAAFARDTRPENDPGRVTDRANVERLQAECATIRPKILKMEELKTACYDAFTGGEDNRLLRAYEYTLTALAEESTEESNMQKLQSVEADVFEEVLDDIVTLMQGDAAVAVPDASLEEIADKLFTRYQTLFAEGTRRAYDASILADGVAADGNSDRGGFYLYDIRGIPSPANWIKLDDQKKYAAAVKGNMMLAWKELYGSEGDDLLRETSRLMAEKMAAEVGSESFTTKTQDAATNWGGDSDKPWQIEDAGDSLNIIEVLEERTPTETSIGTAADSKQLMQMVGARLKAIWDNDPALQAAADDDPEVATVNAGNHETHAFSLLPGEPRLRAIIESADVNAAIDAFQNEEQAKWDSALSSVRIGSRDELVAFAREYRLPSADDWMDAIWGRMDAGTLAKTGKAAIDFVSNNVNPAARDLIEARMGAAVTQNLVPPIKPAELQAKLEKLAGALKVPEDLRPAVTRRAKEALDAKDATQATMADIRAEIAAAMTAEGIDNPEVDPATLRDALREPAGLIFADSNWGGADHRVKYAMVVNPVSGDIEMWQMNEDGSGARRMDEDDWVKIEWTTVT